MYTFTGLSGYTERTLVSALKLLLLLKTIIFYIRMHYFYVYDL